ncbi:hypothetical protein DPSP01_008561 [Paraphaeosphaeria sporulosa]
MSSPIESAFLVCSLICILLHAVQAFVSIIHNLGSGRRTSVGSQGSQYVNRRPQLPLCLGCSTDAQIAPRRTSKVSFAKIHADCSHVSGYTPGYLKIDESNKGILRSKKCHFVRNCAAMELAYHRGPTPTIAARLV